MFNISRASVSRVFHNLDEVEVEYLPITSTLTKIRVHAKSPIRRIVPQREIICFPISNVTKPIDLFAPFPKQMQSFVPINAPEPPSRISSKQNSTLKVYSTAIGSNGDVAQTTINSDTITLRKSRVPTSNRSRSAGSLTTSFSSLKDEKNFANHSRIARQYIQRVNSLSPVSRKIEKRKSSASPIAFGRSISKERMFAEEKKKMEEQLPLCRKSWTASTNILRNPFLKSPKEVKDAVRCTYTSPASRENFSASHSTRKLQSGGTVKTSTVTHTTNKLLKNVVKKDEKLVQMMVKTTPGVAKPICVKSNLTKSSRSSETKYLPKTKQITKTLSNVSLARTSSTYSIDSNHSKRRKPQTIKSKTITPATISSKSRKKKCDTKNAAKQKVTSVKEAKHHTELINFGPSRQVTKDKQKAAINEAIRNGDHSVRSNSFFQQLFLGGAAATAAAAPASDTGSKSLPAETGVATKAHFFDTISRRSSDPKRRSQNAYLAQKQAVTGSKFKRLEPEYLRKSRSLSPRRPIYYDHLSKFDSYYQLSSEEEEFGCTSLNYSFEARSNSEPRRPVTYVHKIEKEAEMRPFSPTREIRSPSSRRIQSFRSQSKSERKSQHESPASRRYHSLDSRVPYGVDAIDSNQYENHLDRCAHRASDKFRDLNRFYSTVERVGQLERATSSTDLHPIRKEGELIDFDVWKQVRNYERAEMELNHLVGKLKRDEREKDFLFRPKYIEDVKWDQRLDRGLRVKEKSVEDLKDLFREKSIQREGDNKKIDAAKDTYKPFWRGNSVLDLATSMSIKYNPSSPPAVKRHQSLREAQERRFGISRNLISTLSKDQVNKIKSQLCEIYSNNGKAPPKREVSENYVINVTEESNLRPSSLVVRSHSLIGEKELLVRPVLLKQRERLPPANESIGKTVRQQSRATYTEDEKKKLLQQLGQEIRDKINGKVCQSVLQPRETRGAIAAKQSALTQPPPTASSQNIKSTANTLQAKLTSEVKIDAKYNRKSNEPFTYISEQQFGKSVVSGESSDNLSSDTSKQTVIITKAADKIKEKINYFERKRTEEPAKTIYVARDDSSPDEDEVMHFVEEKVRARRAADSASTTATMHSQNFGGSGRSSSVSDFKEIFGESERNRNLIEFRTPSPESETDSHVNVITTTASHSKNVSNATSTESFFRSRSISPIQDSKHSMRKQSARSNITDGSASYRPPRTRSTLFVVPPRRFQSDPDLSESVRRNNSPAKVIIKNHEAGDVAWITHKFEAKNSAAITGRSRSRSRKVSSPIPRVLFNKDNRFMPHIDVISKTAALKQEIRRKTTPTRQPASVWTGEVEKIRSKFETAAERLSLIGQMYTSSPDIRELKDASGYLSGSWIAHQYPKPNDNARLTDAPDTEPTSIEVKRKPKNNSRSNSTSPPRSKEVSSILKPFYDIFADQDFDPKKHRPIARYIPDKRRIEAEFLWRRLKSANGYATLPLRNWKHSVKFQGWTHVILVCLL